MDLAVAQNFAIALFIGALVGIDRERRKASEETPSIGGIRTFILFAESGAIAAWISLQLSNPWIFVACVAAVAGMIMAGYVVHARLHPGSIGVTTEAAGWTREPVPPRGPPARAPRS